MFRLGQNTRLSVIEGGLHLERGSLLGRPIQGSSGLILATVGTLARFHGNGTFKSDVMKDGGLRTIGLIGEVSIDTGPDLGRNRVDLKPGQTVERFASRGFGKTIDLDLTKLLITSRLMSIFPNQRSFSEQLVQSATNQF